MAEDGLAADEVDKDTPMSSNICRSKVNLPGLMGSEVGAIGKHLSPVTVAISSFNPSIHHQIHNHHLLPPTPSPAIAKHEASSQQHHSN